MGRLQGKRVVVVEDDEGVARAIEMDLSRAGCHVQRFADGKAALNYLVEHEPDLVILDLKLPSLHGYEVCKELRRCYEPWVLPIIMLTSMDEPIDKLRGYACGADAFLVKPYDPTELLSTVDLTCHGWDGQPWQPS